MTRDFGFGTLPPGCMKRLSRIISSLLLPLWGGVASQVVQHFEYADNLRAFARVGGGFVPALTLILDYYND
eukprot:scaffold185655_cov40-Tisochrysis_lutea.AAC.2